MSSQPDRIADGMNLPMLGVAIATIALGLVLTLLAATMFIGVPLMAIGMALAIGVWLSSVARERYHVPR